MADLWRVAAIAATVVCGLSVDPAFARDPPLLSLTPEHFRATATLEMVARPRWLSGTRNPSATLLSTPIW